MDTSSLPIAEEHSSSPISEIHITIREPSGPSVDLGRPAAEATETATTAQRSYGMAEHDDWGTGVPSSSPASQRRPLDLSAFGIGPFTPSFPTNLPSQSPNQHSAPFDRSPLVSQPGEQTFASVHGVYRDIDSQAAPLPTSRPQTFSPPSSVPFGTAPLSVPQSGLDIPIPFQHTGGGDGVPIFRPSESIDLIPARSLP